MSATSGEQPEGDPLMTNPYAPTAYVSPEVPQSDVEAYRRSYLKHEASVKSIGSLYILGAIFLIPMGALSVIGALASPNTTVAVLTLGGVYLGLGLLQAFSAVGLLRLQTWSRRLAMVPALIWLLAFPIGTMISVYLLYLLLSNKSEVVFSDQYKEVIAQTPHIKYRTSPVVWGLLLLLVALVGFGMLALVFEG